MTNPISEQLSRLENPYADADRASARRYAGVLWLVQSGALVALAPLIPPTEALGAAAGWALLAAMAASGLAIGTLLLRGAGVLGARLLPLEYVAVAEISVFMFLAQDPAVAPLMLAWVVLVPAYRPLGRVLPLLGFIAAMVVLPLAYLGWDRSLAVDTAARVAAWTILTVVVLFRVRDIRAQRSELERTGWEAMQLAVTDPLTGLANRRAFDQVIRREVARVSRTPRPLTMVLADLDGFKAINDRHGHLNGDRYLRLVGETIRAMLREGDAGFRWGGDEFALLLPDTDIEGAHRVCARLGGLVAATMEQTAGVELSLSFGVADYAPWMEVHDLIEAADRELMSSKA